MRVSDYSSSHHHHAAPHAAAEDSLPTVGRPEIDEEHRHLAGLVEKAGQICVQQECVEHCGHCDDSRRHSCATTLAEVGGRMMTLMLDHFHREDELMNRLPQHGPAKTHCEKHRRAHVAFSTRYNTVLAGIEPGNTAQRAKAFETFILDWIRHHALEFDLQLAGLLKNR